MKINSLKLVNFRNYELANLSFNENINIFYGNNGVGKTNLVEAIYTLYLTKSFRTNIDKNLIKKGELSTKIEGVVETNNHLKTFQVVINKDGKKVKIDKNYIKKISDYITNINMVVLEPEEQTIFNDSPASRRKLLNIEISQLEKDYIIYLNNYNKVLKQRNSYLKEMFLNGNTSKVYLDILTNKLVEYGEKIHSSRLNFIEKINSFIEQKYQEIFEEGKLKVKYVSDYNNKTNTEIIDFYKKNFNKEINYGKTLYGIHHDDIVFLLDNQDISEWGSNGQKKNAIFAFKLSELEIIKNIKDSYPILILDDLFSALDNQKIQNIICLLNKNIQTFITTTELERIDEKILRGAKIFKIKENIIEEEEYGRE